MTREMKPSKRIGELEKNEPFTNEAKASLWRNEGLSPITSSRITFKQARELALEHAERQEKERKEYYKKQVDETFDDISKKEVLQLIKEMKKDEPSEHDDSYYPIEVEGYNSALTDITNKIKEL